jgi:hypothetical protein
MSESAWELIFMMFVLKLPIAYLIGVVWWAVRAQDEPFAPVVADSPEEEPQPCPWMRPSRRPRNRGPVGRRSARLAARR